MDGGHEGVLQNIKDIYPGMMSFEEWARKIGVATKGTQGWNRVSMPALLLGKH